MLNEISFLRQCLLLENLRPHRSGFAWIYAGKERKYRDTWVYAFIFHHKKVHIEVAAGAVSERTAGRGPSLSFSGVFMRIPNTVL